MSSLTESAAWRALASHAREIEKRPLKDIILQDAERRLSQYQADVCGIKLNYALQRVDGETLRLLCELAEEQGVMAWARRMLAGEKINVGENRAVLHMALRQQDNTPRVVDGHDVVPDIRTVQKRMFDFVEAVRDGRVLGARGLPIRTIVNIGIGGSDLGPRLVVNALSATTDGPAVHFVANADAYDLLPLLQRLNADETMFIVVSKTFSTAETLLNARMARQWIESHVGKEGAARHFVAVSSNVKAAEEFGIRHDTIFPMWDWVGGRFSVWSAVGLSAAIALGVDGFREFLRGGAECDQHFLTTPAEKNVPLLWALLTLWNRNFLNYPVHAVLPYAERLSDIIRYVQQIEMESNGKSVTRDGAAVDYPTSPIFFGDRGSVGQHGFHQGLHQGSNIVPSDFYGVVEDDLSRPENHTCMMANMVAQASALAFGRETDVAATRHAGGRPSSIIMLPALTPYYLGVLLAALEHKVFVEGIIWNINSFDQPGVELGKVIARALEKGGQQAPDITMEQGFIAMFYKQLKR